MKTFICEICGDAYLGSERPGNCPFCGARGNFIKLGSEANPIVNVKENLSEKTVSNLKETLELEIKANAIYLCMAGKAKSNEILKMYKRLAKVELEHATICTKLLGIEMPEINPESCSEEEVANFEETVKLEDHAASLYAQFAKESVEQHVKIMFVALTQVERDHIELIKNYL